MNLKIPTPDEADASHAVLVEVMTILGVYRDKMVIVGGWVPELLLSGQDHIRSADVDIALDGRTIGPNAYASIRQLLVARGYRQIDTHASIFLKDMPGDGPPVTVKLDMITGSDGTDEPALIQDLSVGRLKGIEIALDQAVVCKVSGKLPSGAINEVSARVANIPAFLCTKAYALSDRQKEKDAYDVYFCLTRYEGGPQALAQACRAILNQPGVREAMGILREKFAAIDRVGPQWAATIAIQQEDDDLETVARKAFEHALAFFQHLDIDADRPPEATQATPSSNPGGLMT